RRCGDGGERARGAVAGPRGRPAGPAPDAVRVDRGRGGVLVLRAVAAVPGAARLLVRERVVHAAGVLGGAPVVGRARAGGSAAAGVLAGLDVDRVVVHVRADARRAGGHAGVHDGRDAGRRRHDRGRRGGAVRVQPPGQG